MRRKGYSKSKDFDNFKSRSVLITQNGVKFTERMSIRNLPHRDSQQTLKKKEFRTAQKPTMEKLILDLDKIKKENDKIITIKNDK